MIEPLAVTPWQERLRPVDDPDEVDLGGAVAVISPAREVKAGWPRALSPWVNLALANDWHVKVGTSSASVADSFHKKGTIKKRAHDIDQWWMNATKKVGFEWVYVTASCTYEGGRATGTTFSRKGQWFTSFTATEMKELLNGEPEG